MIDDLTDLSWMKPTDHAEGYDKGYADALDKALAVVAAMPTAFWINANTSEAQDHKRYVKAAIDALRRP